MLDTGYSMLVTRYSVVVTGYSMLVTGYSMLVTGYSMLVTGYSMLVTRYSVLVTQCLRLSKSSLHGPQGNSSLALATYCWLTVSMLDLSRSYLVQTSAAGKSKRLIHYPASSIEHPASSIQHPGSGIQYRVSSIQIPTLICFCKNRLAGARLPAADTRTGLLFLLKRNTADGHRQVFFYF